MKISNLLEVCVLVICAMIIGFQFKQNFDLKVELKKSREAQVELLKFCEKRDKTRDKVKEALFLSEEPLSVENFSKIVDTLWKP